MSRKLLQKDLFPVQTYDPMTMGKGDWLQLECLLYKDKAGIERKWERCIRKKARASEADAVDIHAILLTPTPEILLVVQYRPALERYCIEFPSGLIDADEDDPINAAQRELKEETGYLVSKKKFELTRVPIAYEPGLTNSSCYVAKVTIDTTQLTEAPVQELDHDEWSLQTLSLPLDDLLKRLLELESQHELLIIDSRVHALASGLHYGKENNHHL